MWLQGAKAVTMYAFAIAVLAVGVSPEVDFDTDVVPILTKAGCNAAACHGAAAGRGGFKLSLFGGDAAHDYDEIVHQLEGRRINLTSPETSLVVTKPTEQIEHGGGYRFEFEGPEAELLTRWVQQGARRLHTRKLAKVEASPATSLVALNDQIDLRVTAAFDDGRERDVSKLAVYTSADPAAVEVDELGRLKVLRRGRHVVIIRFLSEVLTVQVTVPLAEAPVDLSQSPRQNWIDDEVVKTLESLRLPPSPQADDAMLLRRVTLHLTGRLPTPERVRSYLGDDTPEKYQELVDRLLESGEFVEYWSYRLGKLLRVRPQRNDVAATKAFHFWLRQQLQDGRGWNKMAAELLTAEGDTHEYGPANFYLVAGDARAQAEYVSELLMGVRLRCANCHNHPLDRWTQDDYHGLAAIFAKIERGRNVRLTTRGEVIHPASGEPAVARIPGAKFLEDKADGRREFAEWLNDEDNAYFARAIVNRLWKALMGRGLIEPTDDLRSTNPPTHPELLDRLADDFVANGYSLRHTIRGIVSSAAYARSSVSTAMNESDTRFYSHAVVTPLEAEVLADAITDVTGVAEQFGQQPLGTRAIELFTPAKSETLDVLGRCSRADSCEASESTTGGLTTKLHLMNGPLLNRRIADPKGRLHQMRKDGSSSGKIVDEFYFLAFGRKPRWEEAAFWVSQIAGDEAEQVAVLEDFVWALLNSNEFLSNR
jgi:hypothetical protein